jgi:hypothetical protein
MWEFYVDEPCKNKPKLLDQARDVIRRKHFGIRAEKCTNALNHGCKVTGPQGCCTSRSLPDFPAARWRGTFRIISTRAQESDMK